MFADLDSPPKSNEGMQWVDFAELRAVVHPDKCFSKGDLGGIAQRAKDSGGGFDLDERWKLIVDLAEIRARAYESTYPFRVSNDRDTLELNFVESEAQTAYLGLLIASTLRNVMPAQRHAIARDFENTSLVIFEKLMPIGAEIRATWAGAGNGAPYKGNLFQKLTKIAEDLRCTPQFKAEDFNSGDSGDGGVDLVSWHPMADNQEGIPISFAQCGCSKDDWEFKQVEAHPAKHRHRLPTMHAWANYYFLPHDFRRPDGDWARKSDLAEVILVDRLRILRLAKQYGVMGSMPTMEYVAEALVHGYM